MSDFVVLTDCRSQGCRDWVRAGRPYTQSKPTAALRATGLGHGWTVFGYPDKSHLVASRPEDHTPFSATGSPIPAPRWIGNAVDIMPRGSSRAAMADLARLARQIIADKDAGVAGTEWIKYLNWTDEDGNCWHVSWESGHKVVTRSTDKDHIHVSGRSDKVNQVPAPWDPWDRMDGAGEDEDDMGASFGPIEIQSEGITSLTIPPTEGGAADPRMAWLNFCNATGDAPYSLRVFYSTGKANDWQPLKGDGWTNGVKTFQGGERVSVQLAPGACGLDVRRWTTPAYDGPLTLAIERGPVIKK
jgi:hypothetical protein